MIASLTPLAKENILTVLNKGRHDMRLGRRGIERDGEGTYMKSYLCFRSGNAAFTDRAFGDTSLHFGSSLGCSHC